MADSDVKIDLQKFDKEDQLLKEKLIHFLREYPFEEELKKEVESNYEKWASRYLSYIDALIATDYFRNVDSISLDELVSDKSLIDLTEMHQKMREEMIFIQGEDLGENYSSLKEKTINFLEKYPCDKVLRECIEGQYEYWADKYLSNIKNFIETGAYDEFIKNYPDNPLTINGIFNYIETDPEMSQVLELQRFRESASLLKEEMIILLRTASYSEELRKYINNQYEYWADRYLSAIETFLEYGGSKYSPEVDISVEGIVTYIEQDAFFHQVIDAAPNGAIYSLDMELASYERMSSDIDAELVGFDPDFAPGGKHHYKTK
ncbi:hypothetical protein FAI41_07595 [Acetobacteraceae bacterium]|nr:hypothetical protein FAI41_07595 [Acetobacteraceae bacterium]